MLDIIARLARRPSLTHVSGHREEIPAADLSTMWSTRTTSRPPSATRSRRIASRTATSSPASAAPAKPPPPASSPAASTASTDPPRTPAASARAAAKSPPANPSTSSKSTRPPIAASTTCANCAKTSATSPQRDRFKIFIIDEAHQITSEAFNALLKTIEEPPAWVVFILCTTESHKIPATIASRCQHFSFRSVDFNDLVDRMRWICAEEGIEADDEALFVIAQSGEGSVRDSLSALDQAIACCGNKIDAESVRALLGAFSINLMSQVTEALAASDGARMLSIVDELERNGQNLQHFSRELSRYFRNLAGHAHCRPR